MGDNIYRIYGNNADNKEVEVILRFSRGVGASEIRHAIAKEAHRILFEESNGDVSALRNFDYGDAQVKLKQYTNRKRVIREVGSHFTNLFHKKAVESDLFREMHVSVKNAQTIDSPKTITAYASENASHPQVQRFKDSYTKLATLAFDRHEEQYFIGSKTDPFQANTKIANRGDDLFLVVNENDSDTERSSNQEAMRHYYTFLKREYGESKIAQIEHHLDISFKDMIKEGAPLTPEVVYRMNIGALIFTTDDLRDLVKNLFTIQRTMSAQSSQYPTFREAIKYDMEHTKLIPMSQARSILARLDDGGSEAQLNIFFSLQLDGSIDNLSEKDMNLLISLLQPTSDEKHSAYTGKRTFAVTYADYAYGSKQSQKLWLDHQELQETFDLIASNKSWELFYEKLDYVICKRNLLIKDKDVGYKANLLIPAPCDNNGIPRWYRMTSLMGNGHGIMNFTLEPLGADSTLPSIKVFRSTATSGMHADSFGSILNDLNPLNGIGYEGKNRMEKYDTEFIQQRTMPVWVGYSLVAADALQDAGVDGLESAANALEKVVEQRLLSEHRRLDARSLDQIIRDSDDILNDIYYLANTAEKSQVNVFKEYIALYRAELIPLAKEGLYTNPADVQATARKLEMMIKEIRGAITDPIMLHKMDRLIKELTDEVLTDTHHDKAQEALFMLDKRFVAPAKELLDQAANEMRSGRIANAATLLKRAARLVEGEIDLANESLDSKISQDIVFTGHSLGGVSAEVDLVDNLSKQGRMPLPGHMVTGYFLGDPKIQNRDNQQFLSFGDQHSELFKALGARWRLKRIHEVGDPATTAGFGTHLGGVTTEEERKKMSQWCEHEFIVRKRRVESDDKATRISRFVHETQFGQGVRRSAASEATGSDFEQTNVDPLVMGLYDNKGKVTLKSRKDTSAIAKTWDVNRAVATGLQEIPKLRIFDRLRRSLYSKRVAGKRFSDYEDNAGVFAVRESVGVVSKPSFSKSEHR
jgi:hypothetical protein